MTCANTIPTQQKIHVVSVEDAEKYGPREAFILYHIRFWLTKNQHAGRNTKDGYVWSYMTVKDIHKQLSYIPESTLYRLINRLVSLGVLIRSRYNKHAYDRTYWYTLAEFALPAKQPEPAPKKPPQPAPQANSHAENRISQHEGTIPNIKTTNQKTSKPTTTFAPENEPQPVAIEKTEERSRSETEIVFHKAIPKDQHPEISKRIANVSDISLQQAILDVLTAAILTGAIRTNPIAYVSGLVKRSKKDQFDPSTGYHIAKARETSREEQRKRQIEEKNRSTKEIVKPPKEFFDNLRRIVA